jgi:hypothetical protein
MIAHFIVLMKNPSKVNIFFADDEKYLSKRRQPVCPVQLPHAVTVAPC